MGWTSKVKRKWRYWLDGLAMGLILLAFLITTLGILVGLVMIGTSKS